MILTRHKLNKQLNNINIYFMKQKKQGKKSKLYKCAREICRNNNINVKYKEKNSDNIYFIYDSVNKHWAETDGENIWINTFKKYNEEILYYTILHEAMHNIVYRDDKYSLSEILEHKMMENINKKLIY